ncbi:hypothetical protein PtA15_4A802 [Puccinia triticina]|uniref:Uncharacterized protein n=1 Tax=Puccinia triticina TaxID=208348 RepID=A0ABY7CGW2_9BASI|nr:uncharacterized protein PtA15_4A802 [Puccinia triticina]WAQ84349.1 hypothetical protein PtA15_4A802 [Puccinia triticina]WAR55174.1 hypothetical protein PtB15_4B794 [Puccinia triticina]
MSANSAHRARPTTTGLPPARPPNIPHPSPDRPEPVQINNPSSIGHTHPNFFHAPPD